METNFAEKHRIKKYSDIIGQDIALVESKKFLEEFPKRKGLLIYGPAGTGKTSLALALARENNLEVLELNASDLRNRKKLEETLKPATEQMSLFKKGKILLMDEVDGVTGSEIGGIPELIRILEGTKHPIIMTCNDVWQTKMAPLRAKCKLVEMKSLPITTLIELIKKTAEKEGLKKDYEFFKKLAIKSSGDVRAALNDLQAYAQGDYSIDAEDKRDVEEDIYHILRKLFKERSDFGNLFDNTSMSLDEIMLWIEENIPKEYKNEALAKAYDALGNADRFRGRIYMNQYWRFLIYQNIFQSAGIAYAKDKPSLGFTKYEKPKRVLKIWINNQKQEKKKSIARKYANLVHCSTKRALRDFAILLPIIKRKEIQSQMKLTEDELNFIETN